MNSRQIATRRHTIFAAQHVRDVYPPQRPILWFIQLPEVTSLLRRCLMLYWSLLFLIVALVAGVFGFGGIAAGAASIAQVLFFIFLVLFIASLLMGGLRRGPLP
jgi:uncharacterized membrane protein YtjA (UPF0391 family)